MIDCFAIALEQHLFEQFKEAILKTEDNFDTISLNVYNFIWKNSGIPASITDKIYRTEDSHIHAKTFSIIYQPIEGLRIDDTVSSMQCIVNSFGVKRRGVKEVHHAVQMTLSPQSYFTTTCYQLTICAAIFVGESTDACILAKQGSRYILPVMDSMLVKDLTNNEPHRSVIMRSLGKNGITAGVLSTKDLSVSSLIADRKLISVYQVHIDNPTIIGTTVTKVHSKLLLQGDFNLLLTPECKIALSMSFKKDFDQ